MRFELSPDSRVFVDLRATGLLRAVGMGRAQVAQMVTVESVVISMFGALLGLLLEDVVQPQELDTRLLELVPE